MADGRSAAIAAAVTGTTFYNPLKANAFAEELLSHEKTLLPNSAQNTSSLQQIRQLNANKPFINQLAAAWDKDPAILDKLSSQLSSDPKLLSRFKSSMVSDGLDGNLNTSSKKFAEYIKSPTRETLNKLYPAPAAAPAAVQSTATAPKVEPKSTPKLEPETAKTSKPPTKPIAVEAPPERIEPVAAAVKSDGLKSGQLTGEDARTVIDTLTTKIQGIYAKKDGRSPFDNDIQTLKDRLDPVKNPKTAPALQQQIADAINKDPELLAQLNSTGKGGMDDMFEEYDKHDAQTQAGIRKGLKRGVEQFLKDPRIIADKKFRDSLQQQGIEGGKDANPFVKLAKSFGFDISKLDGASILKSLGPLAPLAQAFAAAAKEVFASIKDGNFLGLNNGTSLFADAQKSLGRIFGEEPNPSKTQFAQADLKTGEVYVPKSEAEHKAGLPGAPPPQQAPQQQANNMNSLQHQAPANGPPAPVTVVTPTSA